MPSRSQARIVSITSTKALPEPVQVISAALAPQAPRQLSGVVRDDFFGLMGFIRNTFQNHSREINFAGGLLAIEPHREGMILPIPTGRIIADAAGRIRCHRAVEKFVGMNRGRQRLADRQAIVADPGVGCWP